MKQKWMEMALSLAKKGEGQVSPNPMVGAVLVKDGRMLVRGYHPFFGGPHAEIEVIRRAKEKVRGSTLYVTLEPCSHLGKTPPCTQAIIEAGISKVVAAILDPNPLNSGKGIEELKKAGIETEVGVCEKEAREINEAFFKFMEKKIPFVIVKAAASLDGKIATKTGESKWITGPQARKLAHKVREKVDAILVGVNTVIRDDPSLLPPLKKRFFRIILDSTLQISPEARVLKEQTKAQTIIFTTPRAPKQKVDQLQNKGVTVATVRKNSEQRVSLEEVLKELGRLKILSLLVEGGGEVIGSFFEKGYVDKVFLFLAPRIVGGRNSVTWVESKGVKILSQTPRIEVRSFKRIGEDLLVEGYLK